MRRFLGLELQEPGKHWFYDASCILRGGEGGNQGPRSQEDTDPVFPGLIPASASSEHHTQFILNFFAFYHLRPSLPIFLVLLPCPFLRLREVMDAQTVPEFEALCLLFLFLPRSFLLRHLPPPAPPENALSSAPCPLLVLPQSNQVGDALRMKKRGVSLLPGLFHTPSWCYTAHPSGCLLCPWHC